MGSSWDTRTPTEQLRIRDRILAEWLPEVLTFAPHWTRVAERLGLDPQSSRSHGDLLRIPPSLEDQVAGRKGAGTSLVVRPTVEQVRRTGDVGLLDRMARALGGDDAARTGTLLREYKPVQVLRGGRDGHLAIASSRADLERQLTVGARAAAVLGLGDNDYLVSAVPAAPEWDFWGVRALGIGTGMLALHPRGHGDGLDSCTKAFLLVPSTAVAVHTHEAIAWAEHLAAEDADVSRVERVLLVGPPPDDETRGRILDAWRTAGAQEKGLRALALWAPSVSRSLWAECADGGVGLHLQPTTELLELRGVELPPLIDGAPDHELVTTTLGWRGTALLRLRTGIAAGALDTGPCGACGRSLPRVTGPIVPDAWSVPLHGLDGADHLLDARALPGALGGVDSWSAEVVEAHDHDGLVLHVSGYDLHAERLVDRIERHTGIRPDAVQVEDQASVDRRLAADGRVSDPRD